VVPVALETQREGEGALVRARAHQPEAPRGRLVQELRVRLRSRGWHTVRQSAPTVWLRCPRDQPEAPRGRLVQELQVRLFSDT